MPPRRDIYSSFSDPNSFLGQPFLPRVASAVASGAGNIARAENQFRSDVASAAQRGIQGLGRLATTVGSAITFPIRAAQEAVSGTPLIAGTALGRTPQAPAPSPAIPAFPSGMTGTYSPAPQVAPQIPAQMVQQPQTQVASVNPRPATADDLDAFYRRGAYAPQPAAQVAQPTPQRTAIQTPYGTIFATQQQAANMMTPRTMAQQSTRSPAEQQALLAQMRERGAAIGQRIAESNQRTIPTLTPIGGPQPAQRTQMQTMAMAPQFPSTREQLNTTQRSWSNYVGPNPIEYRVGTSFYDESPIYGRRI